MWDIAEEFAATAINVELRSQYAPSASSNALWLQCFAELACVAELACFAELAPDGLFASICQIVCRFCTDQQHHSR